jgi:hypothetical protein
MMCRPRTVPYNVIINRLAQLSVEGVDLDALPDWLTIYDLFRPIEFFSRWMLPPTSPGVPADTTLWELSQPEAA